MPWSLIQTKPNTKGASLRAGIPLVIHTASNLNDTDSFQEVIVVGHWMLKGYIQHVKYTKICALKTRLKIILKHEMF